MSKKMIDDTLGSFGKLDILVNSVGSAIISDTLKPSLLDWEKIMRLICHQYLSMLQGSRKTYDRK